MQSDRHESIHLSYLQHRRLLTDDMNWVPRCFGLLTNVIYERLKNC